MIDKFLNKLRAEGYEPKGELVVYTGGAWPRLYFDGEKKPSGRYALTVENDRAFASFGSEKDSRGFMTWHSWDGESVDNTSMEENRKWLEARKREVERLTEEHHAVVAKEVEDIWASCSRDVDPTHEYLVAKRIRAECVRQDGERLVLPLINPASGRVESLQYIYPNGFKQLHEGGRKKGNMLPIKKPDESMNRIWICEGYSTGMSVRMAMNEPVIVAFDSGNMVDVAQAVRNKYPNAGIMIAGDNDQFTLIGGKPKNVGKAKAEQAAAKVGAVVRLPEFDDLEGEPTDWNDYACIYGIDKLKSELSRTREIAVTDHGKQEVGNRSPKTPESPPPALFGSKHEVIDHSNWTKHLRRKDQNSEYSPLDTKYSVNNALLLLKFDKLWSSTFMWDDFSKKVRVMQPLPWDQAGDFLAREVTSSDLVNLQGYLQTKNISIKKGEIKDVLIAGCRHNLTHPLRDYFKRLKWDFVPRLDTWLFDYAGVKDQPAEYIKTVGRCVLLAAVKRIFNAGEKFDHMMVLEGGQGRGKSTLVEALGTFQGMNYTTDAVGFKMLSNPHVAQHLQGRLILEFAELKGLKGSDMEQVKSWITQKADEVMPKYSNEIEVWPRQFVIIGTTNEDNWLRDPTGNRRFWPVRVGKIDIAGLELVKEQIWAEAVYRAMQGEKHYIDDSDPVYEMAEVQQAERMDRHVWHNKIEDYLEGVDAVEIEEILEKCLYIMTDRWTDKHQSDVRDILKSLGWTNKPKWDAEAKKTTRRLWCRDD